MITRVVMQLHLLRHAIAADAGKGGITRDADRPLTDEGRERMKRAALGMQRLELSFDRVISSPFVRAWQTAEIAVAACAPGIEIEPAESLRADRDPARFVAELRDGRWEGKHVLAVGHEPNLSQTVASLLRSPALSLNFKKAGLCCLTVVPRRPGSVAILEWFLAPRHLRQLGSASRK